MHILGWLLFKSKIRQGAASQKKQYIYIYLYTYDLGVTPRSSNLPKEQLHRNPCIWGATPRIQHYLRATAINKPHIHAWPSGSFPNNVCPNILDQAKTNQEADNDEPEQQVKNAKSDQKESPHCPSIQNQQNINHNTAKNQ